MASTIESFLQIKPVKKRSTTVRVKLQGMDFDFDIQPLDPEVLADIQVANMVAIPSSVPGGPTSEGANPVNLALDVITEAIVSPDLRNVRLQDHFRVTSPRDLVKEMFKADSEEMFKLFNEILEVTQKSGEPEERGIEIDLVQEAKNSSKVQDSIPVPLNAT